MNIPNCSALHYFHLKIIYYHIRASSIFGGIRQVDSFNHDLITIDNSVQCPLGYGRSDNNSCLPCEIGFHSNSTDSPCIQYTNFSTTQTTGSTQCYVPTACTPHFCHGHGTCYVKDNANQAYCVCKFGYLPSDNCKTPTVIFIQLATIIFTIVLTLATAALYKCIRNRKEVKLLHKQLNAKTRKLDQVNTGARIEWSDLRLLQHPLSNKPNTQEHLAKLASTQVIVKLLHKHLQPTGPNDFFVHET